MLRFVPVVAAFVTWSVVARAGGLVHRLPPDGAWVTYVYQQQAELAYEAGAGSKLADEAEARLPRTGNVVGFLTVRSVGREGADGKPCRWIELEQSVQVRGKTAAGAEAEPMQRTIVLKLLVPEEALRGEADPLGQVKRVVFRDGSREPEEIDDPGRRQYELDRFRPVFPEPAPAGARRRPGQKLITMSRELGELACEDVSFPTKYDGPLSGGRGGRWTYEGEHRLWLSDEVAFGVAGLEFRPTSTETGDGGGVTTIIRSTTRLVVADQGTGATSRIGR